MVANYMAFGRSNEAHDVLAALLEMSPDFTLSQVSEIVPFKEQKDLDRFSDLLRQAGLPE